MNTSEGGFACIYLDTSESGFYDIRCSLLNYQVLNLDGKLEIMQRSMNLKIFEEYEPGEYFMTEEK